MSEVMRGAPLSSRVCDGAAIGAAVWTLCCHLVVALGGGLRDLVLSFGGALLALLAWRLVARRAASRKASHRVSSEAEPAPPAAAPDTGARATRGRPFRLLAIALGVAAVALYGFTGDVILLWCLGVGALATAGLAELRDGRGSPAGEPAVRGRALEAGLWAMSAGCLLVVLLFHRSDFDTPFYVSVAVAAADRPDAPFMVDTIHGVEGLGLHMPAHRVHAWEPFVGALSWLSGLPAMTCYQLVAAGLAALLVPLALARLFRILTPRSWPWSVAATLAVLLGCGGTLWWYANLSFMRLFHGKSVYMSVFLPLAWAYGLRFGAAPSARRWLRLAAVQIAAVGCTSSAIWSVPIAASLAAASAVPATRRGLGTLALAGLSSTYVVGVGLSLVGDLGRVAARAATDTASGELLAFALERMLGTGALALACLAAVFLAWAFQPPGLARRFAIVVPGAVLLLLLNPWWTEWTSRHLTGPSIWRAMWALPVPVLLALVLASPPARRRGGGARLAAVLATAAFVLLVPPFPALSEANNTAFALPGAAKLRSRRYEVAEELVRLAPPRSMVVAPQKVALWIPSFHHHPFVPVARELYLQRIEAELGPEEVTRRMLLAETVSAHETDIEERIKATPGYRQRRRERNDVERFRDGLARYDVSGVCVNKWAPTLKAVRKVLRETGFELRADVRGYEIWIRSGGR